MLLLFNILVLHGKTLSKEETALYRGFANGQQALKQMQTAQHHLQEAIHNPEFMLQHWIELPTLPSANTKKIMHLHLREAILLALRYNPNIQNAELNRIVERYQLRLAHNEFELQFALAGEMAYTHNTFSGVGSRSNKAFTAAPEVHLKNAYGTQFSVHVDNNVNSWNDYTPLLTASITQPLLRGFGTDVNKLSLLNAIDSEAINKIQLAQTVMDQITEVINAYRNLILSGHNLKNQKIQLDEAKKTRLINEQKIQAGELAPTANIQQSYQIESLNLLVEQEKMEFKNATQNLLQIIGLDPKTRLAVPNNVDLNKVHVPSLEQAITIALTHNTQFLAQKMQVRADQRAVKAAKNQQLWRLDLQANAQTGLVSNVERNSANNIYTGRNTNQGVNLILTIPVRDLPQRSQLINAKVALEKDKLMLKASQRALITLVTNTLNTITSQARQYELSQKQVYLAEQSYNLEKKKQAAGISSALDVNNTQNQLIQAQNSLISAKIAYLNQISALQRILGTTLDAWQIHLRFGDTE